jgi:hypothetical protein
VWRGVILLILTVLGALPVARAQGPQGNIQLGNLLLDLKASFETEYNDNINYSNNNKQSDLILRPGLSLSSFYQVSDINSISLQLGIAYEQYVFHPGLSSYTNFAAVTPDSQLAYTFLIDQFTIKVYDSFSYSVQPSDAFAVNPNNGQVITNVSSYARFMNQLGVNVDWDLDRVVLFGGLYRYDVIPQQDLFSFLRRWQYTATAGGRFLWTPNLTVGLSASYTMNYYSQPLQNNSGSWFLGTNVIWQPAAEWSVNFTGGYVFYDFLPGGTNGDNTQPSTFTGDIVVTNKLSKTISHSLDLTRTSSFGYVSNTINIDRITYQAQWQFEPKSKWTLHGWAYYEWGVDSGGTSAETYSKYSLSPELDYDMNKKTSFYLYYQYTANTSNFADRIYNQDKIVGGIRYEF